MQLRLQSSEVARQEHLRQVEAFKQLEREYLDRIALLESRLVEEKNKSSAEKEEIEQACNQRLVSIFWSSNLH